MPPWSLPELALSCRYSTGQSATKPATRFLLFAQSWVPAVGTATLFVGAIPVRSRCLGLRNADQGWTTTQWIYMSYFRHVNMELQTVKVISEVNSCRGNSKAMTASLKKKKLEVEKNVKNIRYLNKILYLEYFRII